MTPAAWAARHGYGTAVGSTRHMAHVDKLHDKDNICALARCIIMYTLFFAVLALLLLLFRCTSSNKPQKGLLSDSEDDVRDNIFNYDEQGGGEEDQVPEWILILKLFKGCD